MGLFSKEQLQQFINENDFKPPEDIQAALKRRLRQYNAGNARG